MGNAPWLFGGLIVIAGVGIVHALSTEVCRPTVSKGDRILLVGDSLAEGLKRPAARLASLCGCDFASATKSGSTIAFWVGPNLIQLQKIIEEFKPTLTLICLGTNDSLSNASIEKLTKSVSEMVAICGNCLWICPPKLPFEERVCSIVSNRSVPHFVSANLPLPQVDSIHLSSLGYAAWAEHIWSYLTCGLSQAPLSGIPERAKFVKPSFMMKPFTSEKIFRLKARKRKLRRKGEVVYKR